MAEAIAGIGYVNKHHEHVMISVRNPTILNVNASDFVQVVLTLDNARKLAQELHNFLEAHDFSHSK